MCWATVSNPSDNINLSGPQAADIKIQELSPLTAVVMSRSFFPFCLLALLRLCLIFFPFWLLLCVSAWSFICIVSSLIFSSFFLFSLTPLYSLYILTFYLCVCLVYVDICPHAQLCVYVYAWCVYIYPNA